MERKRVARRLEDVTHRGLTAHHSLTAAVAQLVVVHDTGRPIDVQRFLRVAETRDEPAHGEFRRRLVARR